MQVPQLTHFMACPECSQALAQEGDGFACTACARRYLSLGGVPLLLAGLTVERAPAPSDRFVEELSRLAVPSSAQVAHGALKELYSNQVMFPDSRSRLEGQRFLHRLRSSGMSVSNPDGSDPASAPPAAPAPREPAGDGRIQVELALLTSPASVRVGQGFWMQARLKNVGSAPLASDDAGGVRLACSLVGPFRGRRPAPSLTRLLIDLPPGGELTQPIRAEGPAMPGKARYRIEVAAAAGQRVAAPALGFSVEAVASRAPDPLQVDWATDATNRSYVEDHERAVAVLNQWLGSRFQGRGRPKVVELGGNAAPSLAHAQAGGLDAECLNVDIDPFGLAFGSMQRHFGGGPVVQDIMADGTRLPFADGSVDAVVMFATLHHFPDPVGLLRHLRTKLAPGGLICAMCEPIGAVVTRETASPAFVEELVDGICEQVFQPWEWRQFFDRAGLRVVHALHDLGSLKIALEVGDESGAEAAPRPPGRFWGAFPNPLGLLRRRARG